MGERTVGRQGAEVLVVDDDRILVNMLALLIEEAGFEPLSATDPSGAIALVEKHAVVAAVVDLMLNPGDGFALVGDLRRRFPRMPIIVLTGRTDEEDKVRALDLGADDYVVKPFSHREFLARVRAHVRRALADPAAASGPRDVVNGTLRLDVSEHVLHVGADAYRLTGTEFRLLHYLMRHTGEVVPVNVLAKHIWGYDDAPARDAVRATLHRLRRKLGGGAGRILHTVPGVGLRLEPR